MDFLCIAITRSVREFSTLDFKEVDQNATQMRCHVTPVKHILIDGCDRGYCTKCINFA